MFFQPHIKQPGTITGQKELLLSDVIIGGCMGAIIAPLATLLAKIDPGLAGVVLGVLGACSGAIFYHVRRGSNQPIQVDNDADDDILYISLGEPAAGYVDMVVEDTIYYRKAYSNDQPSGVTIMSFHNWRNRVPELAGTVANYLGVSKRIVETSLGHFM